MKKFDEITKIKKMLGTGFRNARKNLGLTAMDIAGEYRSKGSMSDFETGKGDMPVSLFYYFIKKMRITFSEFKFLSNNYELDEFSKIWSEIVKLCYDKNESAVTLLMLRTERKVDEGNFDELDYIMLKQIASCTYSEFILSTSEKKKVITHLKKMKDWRNRDLVLYGNTLIAFDVETVKELSETVVARTAFYKSIPENKKLIAQILLNTITALLKGDELPTAIKVQNQVRDLLDDGNAYERIAFIFACGMIDYYRGDIENGVLLMKETVEIFHRIGSVESAQRYQASYDEIVGFSENL